MASTLTVSQRCQAWLADNPDDAVLRWLFRSIVAITVVVLATDLATMNGWLADKDVAPAETKQSTPGSALPSTLPSILGPLLPDSER